MSPAIILMTVCSLFSCDKGSDPTAGEPQETIPEAPLEVGYALPIGSFTKEKLSYAASVGIKYVEASGMGLFVDSNRDFKMTDDEIISKLTEARKNADAAGIDIWSIHMPFGQTIDISLINEEDRQDVMAMHKKLIGFLKILEPEVILFHPSYYLGLNERDMRKSQMIKSANELNVAVMEIDAIMVIENMLGPELLKDAERERPLMRTVQETKEIFSRLPATIYSAIDMNHISNPENLIRAMGSRLKTVHIADGTGRAENHYYPCSGEGENDWTAILAALEEAGYQGPFMYESHYEDEADLVDCYEKLYADYYRSK